MHVLPLPLPNQMSSTGGLHSTVQLSISCKDLLNMDSGVQGLSDPFVVVKTRASFNDKWSEVARTEVCANTLSPSFVRLITMAYHFEEIQYLRFEVYDVDTAFKTASAEGLDLSKQVNDTVQAPRTVQPIFMQMSVHVLGGKLIPNEDLPTCRVVALNDIPAEVLVHMALQQLYAAVGTRL